MKRSVVVILKEHNRMEHRNPGHWYYCTVLYLIFFSFRIPRPRQDQIDPYRASASEPHPTGGSNNQPGTGTGSHCSPPTDCSVQKALMAMAVEPSLAPTNEHTAALRCERDQMPKDCDG
jgi:hypothetical protein